MKKSILSFGLAFMSVIGLFAQSPEGFKYQAVLRDDASNILHDQAVGIQIEILSGDINGMVVYSETFELSTNDYGLVNMEIGKGQTPDDFAAIDWSAGSHFIRISVDPEGGAAYEEMGTSQLMSVPYAMHAKTAESVLIDEVDDADSDPENELQEWSNLPGIPEAFADNVDDVDDADNDPLNELQEWGNLPGIPADFSDNVDDVDDADSDPENELQEWSNLPGVPEDFADNTDDVDDADADPENEIQDLQGVLSESNNANGTAIVNTGTIAVGTESPHAETSVDVSTPLPILLPRMTQEEIDAIANPVVGMLQYNMTESSVQVYQNTEGSSSIANTNVSGGATCMTSGPMYFTPSESGDLTEIQLFSHGGGETASLVVGQDYCDQATELGNSNSVSMTAGWNTFSFSQPIEVVQGQSYYVTSNDATGCLGVRWGTGTNEPNLGILR